MNYLFTLSLAVLTIFCSCTNSSSLSIGKVENLSLFSAGFQILNFTDGSITVNGNLYDKDNYPIFNDSIKIKVNNIDISLSKIPGIGLNDYHYSSNDNFPSSYVYNFEIVLTNGKKYFLGSVESISKINKNDIICNEKGDVNKNCLISWQNIKEYKELEVYKFYYSLKPDSTNNYISLDIRNKLKIKANGKFIVPIAEFSKNNIPINFVTFYFRAEKKGQTNPDLLAGSEIVIKDEIEKQINFKKE